MRTTLISLLIVFSAASLAQKNPRNLKQEIALLKNALLKYHVEPRAIDDDFSSDLFDKILGDLDPDKIFFTSSDIAVLERYRGLLDDEVNGKAASFLPALKERYRAGVLRSGMFIARILDNPIDWKAMETYDPEAAWAQDDEKLFARHRQWLKYQILGRLTELHRRLSSPDASFFDKNVSAAVEHVRVSALRPLNRITGDAQAYDNDMDDVFLQAMGAVFDPHSTFLSTRQYDEFVAALSTEDFYFGFVLGEDAEGHVVITALTPGGAAWKSGDLHVSDQLVSVRWGKERPVDLSGMNLDDVNELLNTNDSDGLELTVRTGEGSEKSVVLRKEKMESEQDMVQSFILDGEIRAGYIYLPDFYTRWDDEHQGGRCAADVAGEIIRLKKEGIDGLILDVRFNGGGSLLEARAMAGIFIDEGPLAMFSSREKKAASLKDMNRGTVYDGPLILMVNGQSASASEVLAAAIQDYNRGLVAGSRTHGKATGQHVFAIEQDPFTTTPRKSAIGYVKLTTQRLYRVTGKSAQGSGVVPDIVLPDVYQALAISESRYPHALKRDSVQTNAYYKPLLPIKKKELKALSSERVRQSEAFRSLGAAMDWIQDAVKSESEPQPLVWDQFLTIAAAEDKREKALLSYKAPGKIFDVKFSKAKEQRLAMDEYASELYKKWTENLTSDIYLQETFLVLRDQISLTQNSK